MKYEEGLTLLDASLEGAKLRLRPILMTSFAFILGCVPLARASGAGALSRQVMGYVVVGGMLAASFIAIFLIPGALPCGGKNLRQKECKTNGDTPGPGALEIAAASPHGARGTNPSKAARPGAGNAGHSRNPFSSGFSSRRARCCSRRQPRGRRGALYYDLPIAALRVPSASLYAVVMLAVILLVRRPWKKSVIVFAGFAIVLGWWLTLQPGNDGNWRPDAAQQPWAEIEGDTVTVHNVRNFDYRSTTDYTPRWETRAVHLSQITGIDLFINYWGSQWMAHPIVSFQFADAPPMAMSIEVRPEAGKDYSVVGSDLPPVHIALHRRR